MEKPKKSIFVYLMGMYLFFFQSAITAPLRKIGKDYFSNTGIQNTINKRNK